MIQQKINTGNLFIVAGPSGAGKNSLIEKAKKLDKSLRYSISVTTREPRPGEKEGDPYFFTDRKSFQEKIDKGEFLEWALVHDNFYGTLKSQIQGILSDNKNAIMDIDVQGALKLKGNVENAVFIFIVPPSFEILKQRIEKRATDSKDTINLRMQNALHEVEQFNNFDFIIINGDLEQAVKDFMEIIRTCRMQTCHFSLVKSY